MTPLRTMPFGVERQNQQTMCLFIKPGFFAKPRLFSKTLAYGGSPEVGNFYSVVRSRLIAVKI